MVIVATDVVPMVIKMTSMMSTVGLKTMMIIVVTVVMMVMLMTTMMMMKVRRRC